MIQPDNIRIIEIRIDCCMVPSEIIWPAPDRTASGVGRNIGSTSQVELACQISRTTMTLRVDQP